MQPLITQPIPIFLTVLAIILLAPMLLSRLKIPPVIGLILAGIAVGPYGFNLLDRDMSFKVFGQVGLLYLMFLAGIEIDMYHLKKNLRQGITFGLYTFAIPLLLGAAASALLLHIPPLAALLLASVFSAHTLIGYPTVARFGLTRQRAVVIAIAGTIVTVLGSLIVLAAVTGIERTGSASGIFTLLLGLAAYCGIMIYLYPRLTRWFFKRQSDPIAQFVYILTMVFAAAAAAAAIGIEGVFGAFLAGLVLNRYVPSRSPLMSRLEFTGNALFIPYFLIGVGMLIDMRLVVEGWGTLYCAAVMSIVAMGAKWLAAAATARTFGLKGSDRSMIYQLSNAHTAVALAVVTIGYGMNLFTIEILNATVLMILVTCTVSSIGVERAATRLKLQSLQSGQEPDDTADTAAPARTLITVSNPLTTPQLVEFAILSRTPRDLRHGSMTALHVRSDNTPPSKALAASSLEAAEATAAAADAALTALQRFDHNVATGILNTAAERDINQIIIGLHHRTTVIDTFLGDKIETLLRQTSQTIVISRCFIPVAMTTRIVVTSPPRAHFEAGFSRWVASLATLAQQIGCRIIFKCHPDSRPYIHRVVKSRRIGCRMEFNDMASYDDFLLQGADILDDDLFCVVSARRQSLSFHPDLDSLGPFLQKYFDRNNLIIIYPGQDTDTQPLTMADTMAADTAAPPSRLYTLLREKLKKLKPKN